MYYRGQKYFNIALVLQDKWLTIFTCPVNTCAFTYAIKNISECFGKNYSSFLDFTRNYERTSGTACQCRFEWHCIGCCQANQGLPNFILLLDFFCSGIQYSVLFTVESIYLLWFIFSRRWCIDKLGLSCKPNIYVSCSTSELRMRLARCETGLSPPVKYFYWQIQGGASFVDHLCYFCLVFVMLVHICVLMPCGHLLEKGWPLGFCLRCLIVKLSLSHWYPGTGVVLDCIYSWSLPSYLLLWENQR